MLSSSSTPAAVVITGLEDLPRTAAVCFDGIDHGLHYGGQIAAFLGGSMVVDTAFGSLGPTPSAAPTSLRPTYADVSEPFRPMCRDTIMPWWSVTKPILPILVGLAVDSGAMSGFNDTISRYVSEFGFVGFDKGNEEMKRGITLMDAMCHTAGLMTGGYGADRKMTDEDPPQKVWDAVVDATCRADLDWSPPGSSCGYSSGGAFHLVGEAVLRALRLQDGKANECALDLSSYSSLVRSKVFEPLGMNSSHVGMSHETIKAYSCVEGRIGATFDTSSKGLQKSNSEDGSVSPAALLRYDPSSGGRGPARELVRLFAMLLQDSIIEGEQKSSPVPRDRSIHTWDKQRLLRSSTARAIQTCYYPFIRDTLQDTFLNVGMGTYIDPVFAGRHCSARTFGHGGSRCAFAFADPAYDLAVAVLLNGRPSSTDHYNRAERLSSALYEDLGLVIEDDWEIPRRHLLR